MSDASAIPTDREQEALIELVDEVGVHDAERLQFVRARPEVFTL